MAPVPPRAVNLGRQAVAIRIRFPGATVQLSVGQLTCTVDLQPTPASRTYTVRLAYRPWQRPHVIVLAPQLRPRADTANLPHVHAEDEPCLYYGNEWNDTRLLATTIIPWTSEWLQYYELWHATGRWLGGGISHEQ